MDAYVYEFEFPLPFPVNQEEAFAALVEPDALRTWFAEHVDVDAKAGGTFRFWGKHTIGVPHEHDARQTLDAFDAPHALTFSWRLENCDSQVTWRVAADGDHQSKFSIRHEFAALPPGERKKEMIDDLWRFHSGNLFLYLKGDDRIFHPDFDDPSPVVRLQIDVHAPPDKVFKALITPEHIKQWFPAPDPLVEPHVGGRYSFGYSFEMNGVQVDVPPLEILEFVENEKLSITWGDWRGDPNVPDQRVSWTLRAIEGGTRVVLEHSGFIRTVDISDYPAGWIKFIEQIKTVAESL